MIIGISGKIGSGKDTIANMIHYCNLLKMDSDPEDFDNSRDYSSIASGWETKRFADKLKDIVCLLIGCTREQLEDREFKEKPLGEEWNKWGVYDTRDQEFLYYSADFDSADNYCTGYNDERGCQRAIIKEVEITPRKLMQLLGTEAGREILHPNIWVNALFADYEKFHDKNHCTAPNKHEENCLPKWIIPDTRFPNEAQAIKDRNGILIRIERPIQKHPKRDFVWIYDNGKVYQTESNKNDSFPEFLTKQEAKQYAKTYNHPSETSLDNYDDFDYVINNNGSLEDLLTKVKNLNLPL